ncbi:MAG: T9SS type A sorting domain-containing protein [Bacteroidota bacterium]
MKKCIIICCLTVLSLTVFSQQYYPLVEKDNSWSVLYVVPNPEGTPFDTVFYTVNYLITGDTVINNIDYHKLYTSYEEIHVSWSLQGLIREDSLKRVWLKWPINDNEELLYDFSVSAGDSLFLRNDTSLYYSVDSVTVVNIDGIPRNKYWISQDDFSWQETWIEGMGSNKGIINSAMANATGGWSWLLCMTKSGQLTYMNPVFNICYLASNSITEWDKPLFQVIPNPAKDNLYIDNAENTEIISISILNLAGQAIKYFDPEETHLDISNFSAGVVLLKISSTKGDIIKKVIIEK